jgi:hypothetical protein
VWDRERGVWDRERGVETERGECGTESEEVWIVERYHIQE